MLHLYRAENFSNIELGGSKWSHINLLNLLGLKSASSVEVDRKVDDFSTSFTPIQDVVPIEATPTSICTRFSIPIRIVQGCGWWWRESESEREHDTEWRGMDWRCQKTHNYKNSARRTQIMGGSQNEMLSPVSRQIQHML